MKADAPRGTCQGRDPRPGADEPETLDGIDEREKQSQEKNANENQGGAPVFSELDAGRGAEGAGRIRKNRQRRVTLLPGAYESSEKSSFATSGLVISRFYPTAYAAGCILAPLRGSSVSRFVCQVLFAGLFGPETLELVS